MGQILQFPKPRNKLYVYPEKMPNKGRNLLRTPILGQNRLVFAVTEKKKYLLTNRKINSTLTRPISPRGVILFRKTEKDNNKQHYKFVSPGTCKKMITTLNKKEAPSSEKLPI